MFGFVQGRMFACPVDLSVHNKLTRTAPEKFDQLHNRCCLKKLAVFHVFEINDLRHTVDLAHLPI